MADAAGAASGGGYDLGNYAQDMGTPQAFEGAMTGGGQGIGSNFSFGGGGGGGGGLGQYVQLLGPLYKMLGGQLGGGGPAPMAPMQRIPITGQPLTLPQAQPVPALGGTSGAMSPSNFRGTMAPAPSALPPPTSMVAQSQQAPGPVPMGAQGGSSGIAQMASAIAPYVIGAAMLAA